MNKHELISERDYDDCLDHVYALNEDTPIIKAFEKEGVAVDPDLVFGLDTRLFEELNHKLMIDGYVEDHQSSEIDLLDVQSEIEGFTVTRNRLEEILRDCSSNEVYRIKGFVHLDGEGLGILNFAFGRWDITLLTRTLGESEKGLRLTVMLARGAGKRWQRKLGEAFGGDEVHIHRHSA
jgi:G3E family GTPase